MGPDVSAISTALVEFGGQVIRERLSSWDLQNDAFVHRNMKMPHALPKISAQGNPRPYRDQDDFTGNDPKFTDRVLTVNQSKWDFQLNVEKLRNTYLSAVSNGKLDPNTHPLYKWCVDHYANAYFDKIYTGAVGSGTYNSSGSTTASLVTGYLTIIADEITATTLTPIATGSITNSNAVTKVESMMETLPAWMLQQRARIIVSWSVFNKYKQHYRASFNTHFEPGNQGEYIIDGFNAVIQPRSWMGSSQRIIIVPDIPVSSMETVLHWGTDDDAIGIYPTPHLDLIQVRLKYPMGAQISDLGAIFVNDQA